MSSKTKTTSGPSAQALPYLTAASNALTNAYNPSTVNGIDSTLQSQIPNVLASTLNNPTTGAAQTYDQNTLNSDANPLDSSIFNSNLKTINGQVTDSVNAGLGTRGLAGGSAATQVLGKSLADADNTAVLGQYNTNISNQNAAASNAASLQGAQDNGISTLGSYLSGTASLPTTVAGQYASGLDSLWGNSQTTTQQGSVLNSLIGAAGTGLAGWAQGGFG